jgi:hypothetical protein
VSDASPFSYAVYRLVPRVERGERMNVGVVVYCKAKRYVGARTALDERRLAALWPDLDPEPLRPYLAAIERIAAGDPTAGPIATLDEGERFRWLASPSSTVIQPSAVHTGMSVDPAAELEKLFQQMVTTP